MKQITVKKLTYLSPEYWKAFSLRNDILKRPQGEDLYREELPYEPESGHWGAYKGNDMVGALCWYRSGNDGIVKHIVVHEAVRGEGFGQRLMMRAELDMIMAGMTGCVLKARVTARGFYETMGYQTSGEVLAGEIPHIMMKKRLPETAGEPLTKVYLIRHGTTDNNRKGIFQGSVDVALSDQGLSQAKCLAKRFAGVKLDAIYTSPLIRARQTAEALAGEHRLIVTAEPLLTELDGGLLEGYDGERNNRLYPEQMKNMRERPGLFHAPGGESSREVYDRMIRAMDGIVQKHPSGSAAVVSHGFAIQLYLGYVKKAPFEQIGHSIVGNASVSTIYYDEDYNAYEGLVNDESHIPEELRFYVAKGFLNEDNHHDE